MKVFDCMSPDSLIVKLVVSGVEKNDHRGLLAPFLRKAPLYFGYPLFSSLIPLYKMPLLFENYSFPEDIYLMRRSKKQKSSLGNKKKAKRNYLIR